MPRVWLAAGLGALLGACADTNHECASFGLQNLFDAQPGITGAAVATDQGMVVRNQVVEFDLPTALIGPEDLHLAIVNSTDQGVNYWNLDGAAPPRLVVTLVP